jgi:hypothetical protein
MEARHPLLIVAKEFRYPKLDRLAAWANSNFERANGIIEASVVTERAILFFPAAMFEVSPFGSIHRYFWAAADPLNDNHIIFGPDLDEKYLRRLFTGIELVIFKLYHIACTDSDPDVHFEQLKTKQMLNKLRKIFNRADWVDYVELFDELFFVRNAFAHSFVELEDIQYRGVPLRDCFGESYSGRSYGSDHEEVSHKFTVDARLLVKPLIETFSRFQLQQIDRKKLFRLCHSVLKERSLVP